ncbi:MAG: hypothetical protein IJQ39_14940 [Thermoguttaceae bacterium]|nr:hypothetical protein [Thermoguttaceae bacterium]
MCGDCAGGVRRLDGALSSAPLNDLDKPGSRQSPAAKKISRKVRKESIDVTLCGGSLRKSLSQPEAKDPLVRGRSVRQRIFSRKERKEMEGGNEASVASEITQFAEGEPKRREVFIPKRRSRKPSPDGLRPRSPA